MYNPLFSHCTTTKHTRKKENTRDSWYCTTYYYLLPIDNALPFSENTDNEGMYMYKRMNKIVNDYDKKTRNKTYNFILARPQQQQRSTISF